MSTFIKNPPHGIELPIPSWVIFSYVKVHSHLMFKLVLSENLGGTQCSIDDHLIIKWMLT
jgi:hypothetical protein